MSDEDPTPPRQFKMNDEDYLRWLRACKPPIAWFMAQDEEQRVAMAILGDQWTASYCVSLAKAIQDPELAEAGLDAETNPESEAVLARRIAMNAIGQMMQGLAAGEVKRPVEVPIAPAPLRMAGVAKRREERAQAKEEGVAGEMSFMGRRPTSVSRPKEVK